MSAVSHIGSMMNMAGMNMMDMPKDLTAAIPQMAGASSTNFGADLLSLSPMIGMLQQLADMDISQSGDGGEVDLGGLANLKQRGEMLANMLSMKIKNFETNLVSSMKNAGLNPAQNLSMKDGGDGMALLNDLPNKSAIETHLKSNDKLQGQFKEIAQMANLLQMIGQTGPDSRPGRLSTLGATSATPAARYAQQSNSVEKRAEATFVLNVMSGGNASYSFE